MSFNYDVTHFQEVLINIKNTQEMQKDYKSLKKELEEIKKENIKLMNSCNNFIIHGQSLVNNGYLSFGKEPYMCYKCKEIYEGDDIICPESHNYEYTCIECV
tara:strand:+ start:507 stop:812 length:306 start_codon:yes stop_codon:yes gene_type:complete